KMAQRGTRSKYSKIKQSVWFAGGPEGAASPDWKSGASTMRAIGEGNHLLHQGACGAPTALEEIWRLWIPTLTGGANVFRADGAGNSVGTTGFYGGVRDALPSGLDECRPLMELTTAPAGMPALWGA